MPAIDDTALIDRWVFREDLITRIPIVEGSPRTTPVVANEVANRPNSRFRQLNEFEETPIGSFLVLDGSTNDLELTAPGEEPKLPTKALTAIAVARIDEPRSWGGLLSALQDNGDKEWGFILGYLGLKPGIGLRGSNGDTRYHWTTAPTPIEPGTWHVLAATFDGTTTSLYVDGVPVATSTVEKGEILYPEQFWYTIGSYHDDDEHFITKGVLGEVRLYDRALEPAEIAAITGPWQPLLDLPAIEPLPEVVVPTGAPASGPIFAFQAPGKVRVTWETATAVPTRLDLTRDGEVVDLFDETEATLEHSVMLSALRTNRIYSVRLGTSSDSDDGLSKPYQTRHKLQLHDG